MGALVLVRPSNQVLIVMVLLPLLLTRSLGRAASVGRCLLHRLGARDAGLEGVSSLALRRRRGAETEQCRPGDDASFCCSSSFPRVWRRRLALLAIPLVVVAAAVAAVRGVNVKSPPTTMRTVAQIPSGNPFLFRVFEMDRIVSPDNGPASRELGRVVQRELLTQEPYGRTASI